MPWTRKTHFGLQHLISKYSKHAPLVKCCGRREGGRRGEETDRLWMREKERRIKKYRERGGGGEGLEDAIMRENKMR